MERESKPEGNGKKIVATSFQGPLPPPSLLRDYNDVVPGLAAKIVDWTTSQTSHRQEMEERAIGIDEKLSTWYVVEIMIGQLLGFLIALSVIIAVVYMAMNGKELAAGALGTIGFGSMVAAFITGRRKRVASEGNEKQEKKKPKQA
ncbi:DUF2335 domain-containing protein [Pseudomonas sp. SG20052]|uniref:DUF2335 domain-containing protein n=1 Tax=Pseudomonas sp. SG20052 TaxID=3074147 RepID=UPI00287F84AF|nr:DUF2335 domain-containing protein [Pseudomonas sp. SG20052]WNF56043.1 DUF2335 domain-containing protein [Pseudomonas sp. SG20052]